MLTNSKRFDQFKHKLKDFHLPGPSSDFFLFLGHFKNKDIFVVRESSVTEPSVVMRNMRQVMNGLKNYTGQLPITTKFFESSF